MNRAKRLPVPGSVPPPPLAPADLALRVPISPEPSSGSKRPVVAPDALTLSEAQVCRVLGLGRRTLKTMRDQGQIPFVRARKRILYPKAAILAWIESNTEGGAKP